MKKTTKQIIDQQAKQIQLLQKQAQIAVQKEKSLNQQLDSFLRKDQLKRSIYDISYKLNMLRREKYKLESQLKKLYEIKS